MTSSVVLWDCLQNRTLCIICKLMKKTGMAAHEWPCCLLWVLFITALPPDFFFKSERDIVRPAREIYGMELKVLTALNGSLSSSRSYCTWSNCIQRLVTSRNPKTAKTSMELLEMIRGEREREREMTEKDDRKCRGGKRSFNHLHGEQIC